jgi:transcription elongation GreA/GreB family factor
MKEQDKIYIDKQGYEELLKEVETLKEQLNKNNMGRKDAYDAGAGDGWDSPEFEEIERNERLILGQLQRIYAILEKVEIVEKNDNNDLVDIGDIIKIEMIYSEDDKEEEIFKLIGGSPKFDPKAEIQEISINSPIGKAMYHKSIGSRQTYQVNERTFTIDIIEKINLSKENSDNEKTLKK